MSVSRIVQARTTTDTLSGIVGRPISRCGRGWSSLRDPDSAFFRIVWIQYSLLR
jgi:hypothetical protein